MENEYIRHMLKKIEKPDISKIPAKRIVEIFSNSQVRPILQKSFYPYSHWEQIKYWQLPDDAKGEEIWAAIKLMRTGSPGLRHSVIKNENDSFFVWLSGLPWLDELLHKIDMNLGGNLMIFGTHDDEKSRHQLLSRGIMEEAIASSQLEGAHTTRKVAKQMLLEGRKPQSKDEQMILNNYQTMLWIEKDLKNIKLSENVLFDLHRMLTKETTLQDSEIGRYRKDEDEIIVGDDGTKNEIYHIPPKEVFIKEKIKRLIDYANDELTDSIFVHPVVKAILLHFWIGYLHPFVDGNGRLARALFYWYLLRKEYWAFGYLPLSKVIKDSPAQYRDAYIYSEQDDNDLTYFLDYNIRKINQAVAEFEDYKKRKWKENSRMAKLAREKYSLNDRQIQIIRYLYKNRDATTSITTHMKVHQIARMTATKDLVQLKDLGLITPKKVGRMVYYYSTDKASELFD